MIIAMVGSFGAGFIFIQRPRPPGILGRPPHQAPDFRGHRAQDFWPGSPARSPRSVLSRYYINAVVSLSPVHETILSPSIMLKQVNFGR